MVHRRRINKLKKKLEKEKIDSLLITKRENIFYLSGFEGESSNLIVTATGKDFILTDPRYQEEVSGSFPDFEMILPGKGPYSAIADIVKKNRLRNLGFESSHISYHYYTRLKTAARNTRLTAKKGLIEDMRIVKDPHEIEIIKESISIAKKAYLSARREIDKSSTGQKIAAIIDCAIRKHGGSAPAFQTIVARNPHSSNPHAQATGARFGSRSAIMIDMGVKYRGYNSDLTRVVFLGRISKKFRYIYDILKTAQKQAIRKIKPGKKARIIDDLARSYIEKKGFGKFFLHALGHGVGLEVHEPPGISRRSETVLKPGMVFTVEPGIYIQGWGGLRVEDMVRVTNNGCEVLTNAIPK